jgi:hypothetical protein
MKFAEDFAKKREQANKTIEDTLAKAKEEAATYGMTAEEQQAYTDAAEVARLTELGATEEQIAALKDLQGELAEAKRQKDALTATSNNIGVASMGEAFDLARQQAEAPTADSLIGGFENAVSNWTQSFGPLQTAAGESPQVALKQDRQVPLLERIANGIQAIADKEGIVIEEVSL